MYIPQNASVSVSISAIGVYASDGVYTDVNYNSISVIQANRNGVKIEMNFNNTKTGNRVATVHIDTGSITIS